MSMNQEATPNILLVDDDPVAVRVIGRVVSKLGRVRVATDGVTALKLAREKSPDLILLDADMPSMSGFDLCLALKAEPELTDVPVVFITGHGGPAFELQGFEVGAADFITKPISEPLLTARVKTQLRIKRLTDELKCLSSIDGLTSLANRRCFDETLKRECMRLQRNGGQGLGLLMIDIDHFKQFNDGYGHPAGDACLRSVAQALAGCCQRPGDLAARYGGEEFAVLLPDACAEGARHVAHRIIEAVLAMNIPHAYAATAPRVTISVGIAHMPRGEALQEDDLMRLVSSADKGLYAAKQAGRNRAICLQASNSSQDIEGSRP